MCIALHTPLPHDIVPPLRVTPIAPLFHACAHATGFHTLYGLACHDEHGQHGQHNSHTYDAGPTFQWSVTVYAGLVCWPHAGSKPSLHIYPRLSPL